LIRNDRAQTATPGANAALFRVQEKAEIVTLIERATLCDVAIARKIASAPARRAL
jgi:hypothetical protein